VSPEAAKPMKAKKAAEITAKHTFFTDEETPAAGMMAPVVAAGALNFTPFEAWM